MAAGNGSSNTAGDPYDDSDSVLELSSSLTLLQYFSPSTWLHDNLTDADLGSSSPAVLPDGLVFQAGKSGTGYLLQGSSLGGIGGQVAQLAGLCGGVVDGGTRSPTPWSTHRAAGEWWPCGWGRRRLR